MRDPEESSTISLKRIMLDDILREASEYHQIARIHFLSARRSRWVARPRQEVMYLGKMLTPRSLPEIGRYLGGRDHTTVIHGIRQIENFLERKDKKITSDIRDLIAILDPDNTYSAAPP